MATGTFVNNVNKSVIRTDLDQQFDTRLTNSQTTTNTASENVYTAPNANITLTNAQDIQTIVRLDPDLLRQGDGVHIGHIRTEEEDKNNLSDRQKIDSAQANLDRATNRTTTNIRAQSHGDIVRHRQKNQARCNHLFDAFSDRCLWCNKRKSSHVYDQ